MKRGIFLGIILAALAGCATSPQQPEVRTITNTVQVPVPVPCVTEANRPKKPTPTPIDPATASTEQLAAAELADAIAEQDYANQIDALWLACSTLTSKGAP